jgi:hypothetical protein
MAEKKSNVVRVLHLDLTPMVRGGRSDLVFSLAVLGGLADPAGRVFLTPKNVRVIIELTMPREFLRKVILWKPTISLLDVFCYVSNRPNFGHYPNFGHFWIFYVLYHNFKMLKWLKILKNNVN